MWSSFAVFLRSLSQSLKEEGKNTSPNRLLVLSVYLYLLQLLGYSLFILMFLPVLCLGGLRGGACGHVGAQRVWSVLCGVRCTQRKWHTVILSDLIGILTLLFSLTGSLLPFTGTNAQRHRAQRRTGSTEGETSREGMHPCIDQTSVSLDICLVNR